MNKILLMLALLPALTLADVFKCVSPSGQVQYQPAPCAVAAEQQTVAIKNIDPGVVKKAQDELQEKLDVQAQKEAKEAAEKRALDETAMRKNKLRAQANAQRQQAEMANRQLRRKNQMTNDVPPEEQ